MLFLEQGITITSMLTAIGMVNSVWVEALLLGGSGIEGGGGKPPPKDEAGAIEWVRNKFKAFSSLIV